jgi:hypothetical protein
MESVCLSYHISDYMVYQYDKMTQHGYYRSMILMHASPKITYQDILDELNVKKSTGVLESVTVLEDRRVVSLSVSGFKDIANKMYERELNTHLRMESLEAAIEHLAKEMIMTRDYNANGGGMNRGHKLKDYWPK